jgi:sortase A
VQFWRVTGAAGRFMVRAGAVILLFVAFQFWGTGLVTSRAQDSLTKEFEAQLANIDPAPDTREPLTESQAITAPIDLPVPELGDPIGRLTIDAIGSDFIMVQGVDLKWLQEGPGHFPQTPMPGQPGNAAVAGHRTTYKAPFHRIDELIPGDTITVQTLQGTFTYKVDTQINPKTSEPIGHRIIAPDDVSILDQSFGNRLTLMACHPKFSADQRIVVTATLISDPAPPTPIPDTDGVTTNASEDALAGGDPSAWPAAIFWSALTAVAWFGTWYLARFWNPSLRRKTAMHVSRLKDWKFLTTYAVGTPIVGILLFITFTNVSQLLPASY